MHIHAKKRNPTLPFLFSLVLCLFVFIGTSNGSFISHAEAKQDSSVKLVKGVVKTVIIFGVVRHGSTKIKNYLIKKAANDARFKQGLIKQLNGFARKHPKYKQKALALLTAVIAGSTANQLYNLTELEDRQYRTYLANGGNQTAGEWKAQGKPDTPQVIAKSRFGRFKDKVKAAAKRIKSGIENRKKGIERNNVPDSLNKAGADLPILNLQPSNRVVTQSAEALAKVRGDVIIRTDQLSVLKNGDTLTIVAHGSPTKAGGMQVDELASLLSQNNLTAGTIELVACKTGCSIFAQRLANLTGAKVKAPLANINVLSDIRGVPQVRDPITGILRSPGDLIKTFEPIKP